LIQQNELITMLIGSGVAIYVLINHSRLSRIPSFKVLLISYLFLFAGWVLTVAEGFFLGSLLNFIEHLCYATGSILAAMWCWRVFMRAGEPR